MFYDSMIAKVINYGKDRIEAISRMQKALSECYIGEVINNIEFLESIFHNPNFIAARSHTTWDSSGTRERLHTIALKRSFTRIWGSSRRFTSKVEKKWSGYARFYNPVIT